MEACLSVRAPIGWWVEGSLPLSCRQLPPDHFLTMNDNKETIVAGWLLEEEEIEDVVGTENVSDFDAVSQHCEIDTNSEQSDVGPDEYANISTAPTLLAYWL
ncbi:hypothetical protein J6590_032414 [Homalodisca vitripennis]|nr:hypothetical protein J6590_032414 [Homalodisca vitripennis]